MVGGVGSGISAAACALGSGAACHSSQTMPASAPQDDRDAPTATSTDMIANTMPTGPYLAYSDVTAWAILSRK
jgi:hypothetical protein